MAARVHQSHNLNYAFNSIEMKAKLEDRVANPPHHKKHFDRLRSIERNIGLDWLLLVTLGYSCIFDCECICCFSATTCGLLSDVPLNVQKSPPGMFCWCNATVIPSWGGGSASFLEQIFSDSFYSLKNAALCKLPSLVTNDLPFK